MLQLFKSIMINMWFRMETGFFLPQSNSYSCISPRISTFTLPLSGVKIKVTKIWHYKIEHDTDKFSCAPLFCTLNTTKHNMPQSSLALKSMLFLYSSILTCIHRSPELWSER